MKTKRKFLVRLLLALLLIFTLALTPTTATACHPVAAFTSGHCYGGGVAAVPVAPDVNYYIQPAQQLVSYVPQPLVYQQQVAVQAPVQTYFQPQQYVQSYVSAAPVRQQIRYSYAAPQVVVQKQRYAYVAPQQVVVQQVRNKHRIGAVVTAPIRAVRERAAIRTDYRAAVRANQQVIVRGSGKANVVVGY